MKQDLAIIRKAANWNLENPPHAELETPTVAVSCQALLQMVDELEAARMENANLRRLVKRGFRFALELRARDDAFSKSTTAWIEEALKDGITGIS